MHGIPTCSWGALHLLVLSAGGSSLFWTLQVSCVHMLTHALSSMHQQFQRGFAESNLGILLLKCKLPEGNHKKWGRKKQKKHEKNKTKTVSHLFSPSVSLVQNALWEQELLQLKSQVQQVSVQLLYTSICLVAQIVSASWCMLNIDGDRKHKANRTGDLYTRYCVTDKINRYINSRYCLNNH